MSMFWRRVACVRPFPAKKVPNAELLGARMVPAQEEKLRSEPKPQAVMPETRTESSDISERAVRGLTHSERWGDAGMAAISASSRRNGCPPGVVTGAGIGTGTGTGTTCTGTGIGTGTGETGIRVPPVAPNEKLVFVRSRLW